MMYRYIAGLLLVLVVACMRSASAEIPTFMMPGASEQIVRNSLKLEKCWKRVVDTSLTDCEEASSEFDGRPVTVKAIFHSDKLASAYIYFNESEFGPLASGISEAMGQPRNSLVFDIPGLPTQKELYWGNKNLFVSLKSSAFGDKKRCLLILHLPELTPSIMHPLFLQSMGREK
jgi:hypothetical protein